jgi:hypothetical protein
VSTTATTYTASFKVQWQVSFAQSGITGGDTSTNTVVTVNGSSQAFSASTYNIWVDNGGSFSFSYAPTVATTAATKQYVLTGVTPNSTSPVNNVTAAASYTGTYVAQYQITIKQSGIGNDTTGTVATYSGTQKGVATGSVTETAAQLGSGLAVFFDGGTSLTVTYTDPVATGAATKQYALTGINGGTVTLPSTTLTVSAATTVTGNYVAQYQITIKQSGIGNDTTGTVATYGGTQKGVATGSVTETAAQLGSGLAVFFDYNTSLTVTYSTPVSSTTAGKAYALSSITGGTVTLPSTMLTVTSAVTITGNYDAWVVAWGNGTSSPSFSAQYSDVTGLYAILTKNGTGVSGTSVTFCVYAGMSCGAGSDTGSATTSSGPAPPLGVATDGTKLSQAAGSSYTASATATPVTGLTVTITHAYTINQEDAQIFYTGDTLALVNGTINLRATVLDSAAVGYTGNNPETGASATIGDITKMWIEFDIYTGTNCGVGIPTTSHFAQVQDTGTIGDGIGTATSTFTSNSEGSYCVIAKLVAGNAGGTNQWYTAPDAQGTPFAFYTATGQFATGGGWIIDPYSKISSHGNFGFNGRNGNKGPAGQSVYVWRDYYNGVLPDWVVPDYRAIAGQLHPPDQSR